MSWKASGYVKELREDITVTEKFVLLVLAEYHNTEKKAAWPSVATLAADCLMTERGVQQILTRLTQKKFIIRSRSVGGRGNVSAYQIVGVDTPKGEIQTVNGDAGFREQNPHSGAEKGERNHAQPTVCNKEEPVLETKAAVRKDSALLFPDWVPMEAWDAFIEMRRKMRNAPLTKRAVKMLFSELCRLRSAGEDPERVLNVATMKGWRGLFPVSERKDNGPISNARKSANQERQDRNIENGRRALEILQRRARGADVDSVDAEAGSNSRAAGDLDRTAKPVPVTVDSESLFTVHAEEQLPADAVRNRRIDRSPTA